MSQGTNYALVGDSSINSSGGIYSSISAANSDKQVYFGCEWGNASKSIGFEDLPGLGDNDFNDITLKLNNNGDSFSYEHINQSSLLANTVEAPNLDSIWMEALGLMMFNVYQIAELITGNENNFDLTLVIDVASPNNKQLNPTPNQDKNIASYP